MRAAVLAGIVLRLVFVLGYWIDKPLTHDEREYLHLAVNLAEGRGLRYTDDAAGDLGADRYGRAPMYPAFVAAVGVAGGRTNMVRNVRVAQVLVSAVGIWCLALLARRAAGPRAEVAAAWVAAVYPPFVSLPAYVLSETLYMTTAAATVVVLGRAIDGVPPPASSTKDDWRTGMVAGLLAGTAVLIRPAMLFFLLLTGLWLLARRRAVLLAALALASVLVIAPWTLRNFREYHRFVLVASEGGLTFWTGNHPQSPGEGDMAANPAIKVESRRLRAAHPGLSEEALEPVYYREAFRAIVADPLWWMGLLARKLFYTVVPLGPSYTLHSRLYRAGSVVPYVIVLPVGLLGLLRARRHGTWPRALVLLAGSAVLVCVVFLPQERFRIPVIDPTLIVGAAAWWGLRSGGSGRALA